MPMLVGALNYKVIDLVLAASGVPPVAELAGPRAETIAQVALLGREVRKGLAAVDGKLLDGRTGAKLGYLTRALDRLLELPALSFVQDRHSQAPISN